MTPDIESTLILHVGKNHAEVPLPVKKELLFKKKEAACGDGDCERARAGFLRLRVPKRDEHSARMGVRADDSRLHC